MNVHFIFIYKEFEIIPDNKMKQVVNHVLNYQNKLVLNSFRFISPIIKDQTVFFFIFYYSHLKNNLQQQHVARTSLNTLPFF